MVKNKVIIFKKGRINPTILINPVDLDTYYAQSNAFVNPCMKQVEGIPPHLWKPKPNSNSLIPKDGMDRHNAINTGLYRENKPLTGLGKQTSKWVKSIFILTIINTLGIFYGLCQLHRHVIKSFLEEVWKMVR